jgi:hypothetical protein
MEMIEKCFFMEAVIPDRRMRIENKKYVLYIKQEFGTFADGMVY